MIQLGIVPGGLGRWVGGVGNIPTTFIQLAGAVSIKTEYFFLTKPLMTP